MKNKRNTTFSIKNLSILSLGAISIFTLLYVVVAQKNSYPQASLAAPNKTQVPFICDQCNINDNTGFGDRFKGKDLTNAYFNGALQNTDATGVILDKATLVTSQLNSVNFTNASFINAILANDLPNSNIFTNADFTNANLTNTNQGNNDYTNANFTNANLTGSVFGGNTLTGAIWSNTTCADGTNSNNDGNTCIGHLNGQ